MNTIITISREFGSGGREVGRRLAEKLQIAYYDQEIVAEMCRRTSMTEEYVRYVEKERPLPLLPITTARTFGFPTNYAVAQNLNFYRQESGIIQELAEKSDCVIVGRCGDYVLARQNPIRLFVYADMDFKLARCREKGEDAEGVGDQELSKKIRAVDRKRARYYQFFSGQVWGDRKNYDLCVNTGRFEMKELVRGVERFVGAAGMRPASCAEDWREI